MEFTELKLEKSDFESVFEIIGPSVDSLISERRKEEILNINALLDDIKKIQIEVQRDMEDVDGEETNFKEKKTVSRIFKEHQNCLIKDIDEHILFYLAAKAHNFYPNGLSDLISCFNPEAKSNISYNLVLESPFDFFKNTINKIYTSKNDNNQGKKDLIDDSELNENNEEEQEKMSLNKITNEQNFQAPIDLNLISKMRADFAEKLSDNQNCEFDKKMWETFEFPNPQNFSWEKVLTRKILDYFEDFDITTRKFYGYVIFIHIYHMKNELKNSNLFTSNFEVDEIKKKFEELKYKYTLLIITRIFHFLTSINLSIEILEQEKCLLRFNASELTYSKLANYFEYSLQVKPYAKKFDILYKKVKAFNKKQKLESINESYDSKKLEDLNSNDKNEKEEKNKENDDIISEEKSSAQGFSQNLLGDMSQGFKFEKQYSEDTQSMGSLLTDAVMRGFYTDTEKEFLEQLKNEEQNNCYFRNHLDYPPYEVYKDKHYFKFKNYDKEDCYFDNETLNEMKFQEKNPKNKTVVKNQENEIAEISQKYTIFRSIDKLRLLNISFDHFFVFSKLQHNNIFSSNYFKREEESLVYKGKSCRLFLDSINVLGKNVSYKHINHIRNIFGEEISYYILWIRQLIVFLFFPSLIGIFLYLFMYEFFPREKNEIAFHIFAIKFRIKDIFKIFLSFVSSVMVMIFLKHWKSTEKFYNYIWGLEKLKNFEPYQESFKCSQEIKFIFKQKIKIQNRNIYWLKNFISNLISFIFVLGVIYLNFILQDLKKNFSDNNKDPSSQTIKYFWIYFPTVLNACLIKILSYTYRYIAYYLSYWENHERNSTRINSLALKIFLFEFVNNFFSYFYIGFYKYNSSELSCVNVDGSKDCTEEIQIQAYYTLITLGSINFIEIGWPYVTYLLSLKKLKEKAKEKKRRDLGLDYEKEIELEQNEILRIKNSDDIAISIPYANNMIEEYIEVIIYLAYVLMLTSSAPLTPIFVMLLLMFEKFVDTYKFYNLSRIQSLHAYSGLKVCSYMLRVTLYLGTVVSFCLTLFSRTFEIDTIIPKENEFKDTRRYYIVLSKIFILMICENLILVLDYLISYKGLPLWFENLEILLKSYKHNFIRKSESGLPDKFLHIKKKSKNKEEVCENLKNFYKKIN